MKEYHAIEGVNSCDECAFQEEGGHYCLLHSKMMKNMNIKRCKYWEEKQEVKTVLFTEDVIHNCLADERMAAKAKRYGKKIVVDNKELRLLAYRWQWPIRKYSREELVIKSRELGEWIRERRVL